MRKATHRGWRLIFGGFAVLLVSGVIRSLRPPIVGAPRQGSTSLSAVSVKPSSKSELVLPPAAHEAADVGPRFIRGAFGLLLVSLAVAILAVYWLLPLPDTDRTLHPPLPLYPEPRLQPSPREEMQRFLAEEQKQLTAYGWVDKEHGIVHIPIDVAMNKVAHGGIPGWPTSSDQSAASQVLPATKTAGVAQ